MIGVDLVMLIINKLLSPEWESVPHGTEGYYFAENGTVEMKQLALSAARIFSGQANPDHRPFTQEEMDKVFPFAVRLFEFLVAHSLTKYDR